MASLPALMVPISMPPHPSLAMLASLAAIALDAALRKQPYKQEPVLELARVLNERLGVTTRTTNSTGGAARLLDPETTELLMASVVLKEGDRTMDALAKESAGIAAALQAPLDKHDHNELIRLRAFALKLSSAALRSLAPDPLVRRPPRGW